MNRRKQFGAVATRHDMLADQDGATLTVAGIVSRPRAGPDQPRGDPGNAP